ncbi:class I SAM-dependent methyltransferase [Amycolatopsis roodepoortensis]|uniref:class I SAM-dependent methyltransferase n=1 Tax=Amycolatopsis roodepoortensis TaxID=700274 RepID=UPI00214BD322|nr:class I SAM-dependent methyltransferase [Amycolatopsis roodepoortensis]UUV35921.1 class I SAM-dependent methyltransferase [Amycolatopsis roodepoortensis]
MKVHYRDRGADPDGLPGRAEIHARFDDPSFAASYAASYHETGPAERYFSSRLHAVFEVMDRCPGGDLLDVGCGPGVFVRRVLDARPGDFRITAVDRSPAMIVEAAGNTADAEVDLVVGVAEALPFPDAGFDVVVAMGVLEYCDPVTVLRELERVVRPGGIVLVSMLNPLSLYRLFEWGVYWPLLRLLGRVEGLLGRSAERRHSVPRSGIRTLPAGWLWRRMREAGLHPLDVVHYDLTPAVPPFDRLLGKWTRRRERPADTVTRGFRRWMGTAYLVVATSSR